MFSKLAEFGSMSEKSRSRNPVFISQTRGGHNDI